LAQGYFGSSFFSDKVASTRSERVLHQSLRAAYPTSQHVTAIPAKTKDPVSPSAATANSPAPVMKDPPAIKKPRI
jgi:hypothetical protein